MKALIIITCLCLFSSCKSVKGQSSPPLALDFHSYSYSVDTQNVNVCEVIVKNMTSEDYAIWFERENIVMLDDKNKINLYFFKTKQDFNFYNLIIEKLIKDNPVIFFDTFLKKIKSKSVFTLKIIGTDITIEKVKKFVSEHMVFIAIPELVNSLKLQEKSLPWFGLDYIDVLDSLIK